MQTPSPHWYKDAIIYQLHVRSFCDANDDGIGDFRGLTSKLDYLQDLGVTAIWLLPFYPSPLRDDGYDIADYRGIHPSYGTLHDFRAFLREAHQRGLRVVTELVLNHTSDEHPWFRRARAAKPGSRWRNFYVWSDSTDRYKDARIIFKDFERSNWTWDQTAGAYYWHRFYYHQPDLNFDNPEVRRAMLEVMDHWFEMGVDGMRLDAVPYLFEREGTSCENLPETHAFLKELRAHVDARFQDRMLLAEANQWPEDAASYFGTGDECHAAFHFPLMPRLFIAVQMEDRFPIVETLNQTPAIPDDCQWMLFLRNHDELTLEMVTEEERDYMYRAYAQDPRSRINLGIRRRLAPLMGNNRRKIELLNALLLTLPGTPIIYYGDELGMGDNIFLGDRNGVRTPMQWNADRSAGFSSADPRELFLPAISDFEYHYETVNVEAQQAQPHSLLRWMTRLIWLRQQLPALGHGSFELLQLGNPKVLAFVRRLGDERVVVVANLSRFPQYVALDLAGMEGASSVEAFGQGAFPKVTRAPYPLTLGPHGFYWLAIRPAAVSRAEGAAAAPGNEAPKEIAPPLLKTRDDWRNLFAGRDRRRFEALLPGFLASRRWFLGNERTVRAAVLWEVIPIPQADVEMALVQVFFIDGEPQRYFIPLAFGDEEQVRSAESLGSAAILARVEVDKAGALTHGVLYDAFGQQRFAEALLEAIASRRRFHGEKGELAGRPTGAFRRMRGRLPQPLKVSVPRAEHNNSTLFYDEQFVLKQIRRVEEGAHPEVEMGQFFLDHEVFARVAPLAGTIEYIEQPHAPATVAILHGFVHSAESAWSYALDAAQRFLESIAARQLPHEPPADALPKAPLLKLAAGPIPPLADQLLGPLLEAVALLGRRTAEMHVALASDADAPCFGQEPFTQFYQRSLYQTMRNLAVRTLAKVQQRLDDSRQDPAHQDSAHQDLREDVRSQAAAVVARQADLLKQLHRIIDRKIHATRIRCHGDYHLDQVLYTGNDFAIIDFEGIPDRSISERRLKSSPFRDVASMLRSFEYAGYASVADQLAGAKPETNRAHWTTPWLDFWLKWVGAAFLKSYLAVAGPHPIVPQNPEETQVLLDFFLMERALRELRDEFSRQPDRARIPLHAIEQLLGTPAAGAVG